jgi:hypothetical protein
VPQTRGRSTLEHARADKHKRRQRAARAQTSEDVASSGRCSNVPLKRMSASRPLACPRRTRVRRLAVRRVPCRVGATGLRTHRVSALGHVPVQPGPDRPLELVPAFPAARCEHLETGAKLDASNRPRISTTELAGTSARVRTRSGPCSAHARWRRAAQCQHEHQLLPSDVRANADCLSPGRPCTHCPANAQLGTPQRVQRSTA